MLLFSHGSFLWAADLVRLLLFMKKYILYLESAPRRIIPITPAEINSPAPTVSIINGIGRLMPYP